MGKFSSLSASFYRKKSCLMIDLREKGRIANVEDFIGVFSTG
jgi:hypothetical protein